MIHRQLFDFDTGTTSQQSISGMGEIRQVRWAAADAGDDTGASLSLTILPDESDTGVGWQFLSRHVASFVDTGVRLLCAGERIRADVPSGVSGKLYVWTDNRGS